ncbi:response regulator [Gordonia sp. HNM0687]|uniref:Response regulator n=1 Tax=Gordonia mangrovi TaxID=2665643 RepID=A0A6L7GQT2_9ACTN|nr:response regulator [Gordonia mangrovi]MXP22299.1 response regulator [Gordonia mangrovi]UVF77807.1 response regulator [Gordonia mangrovi]
MSTTPLIVCVDDQREVGSALLRDLEPLTSHFTVVDCTSAAEAWEELEEADSRGRPVALLICDHLMPVETGVAFLTRVRSDFRFRGVHSILLTGMATQQDTIEAINAAQLDRYVSKPWDPQRLLTVVKEELTRWVLENSLPTDRFEGSLAGDVIMRESWRDGTDPRA